ncbi:MAG: bifunctional riboflavin kinase/FAD synthetase [Myxococcota bacterium]|nr:bifunctional riboflavin kinase/FAD synthetase [Myxococcota bacterium]
MALQVFPGSRMFPAPARPVLTIGNFDGVHRGHRVLLDALVARAEELDAPAAVYTFDPAPREILQPDRCPPRITSLERKLELLEAAGVDMVVVEPFSLELGGMAPADFADEVIGRRLHPRAMVVGYDFRYGKARAGDVHTLRAHFPELSIRAVEALQDTERIVSSSAIREAVAEGRIDDAARCLGRPYRLTGVVEPGDQRGRKMGVPTANIKPDQQLLPALGVYAVRAWVPGASRPLPAVANIGVRPTFERVGIVLEVHFLEGGRDFYGQRLAVDLIRFLRPERRFDSAESLRAQIALDIEDAQDALR